MDDKENNFNEILLTCCTISVCLISKEKQMSIWKGIMTAEWLNKRCENTLVQHLGIEFTEVRNDLSHSHV